MFTHHPYSKSNVFLQRPPCRVSTWPVPLQSLSTTPSLSEHQSILPKPHQHIIGHEQFVKFQIGIFERTSLVRKSGSDKKNSSNKKSLQMGVPHLPHRPAVSRKHSQPLMRGLPRGPHSLTCAAVQTPPLAFETAPSLRSARQNRQEVYSKSLCIVGRATACDILLESW